jgi:hypothetical protein
MFAQVSNYQILRTMSGGTTVVTDGRPREGDTVRFFYRLTQHAGFIAHKAFLHPPRYPDRCCAQDSDKRYAQ